MIIAVLSMAAALAAAPPDDKPSRLILDSDHQTAWVKVDEKKGLQVWWDRNAKGTIFFEQREYPVVLLRAFSGGDGELGLQADIANAVDCENNQIATIKGYFPWRKGDVEYGLKFDHWPAADREEIHALMRETCSEGWGQ